ncbi:MAG: type II toxin-antitoxin system RelE/ParE family toxin [Opitutaceae bacterium]|jgi:proteic killer suppression protein|nr:type II toxin-antitoxin system RelE/ParE family toxin [Opitutaceae bacterium]
MIKSFANDKALQIWEGKRPKGFPPDVIRRALTKLQLLHTAKDVEYLRIPPGNRLELLKDDRVGQHSIRINDKWRVCFKWNGTDAENVEIVDYH